MKYLLAQTFLTAAIGDAPGQQAPQADEDQEVRDDQAAWDVHASVSGSTGLRMAAAMNLAMVAGSHRRPAEGIGTAQ